MRRGEVWLAHAGAKRRPVLVLTRSEVIDVRELVTVAEITTSARGLAVEVPLERDEARLRRPSVVNCDGLHTVAQEALSGPIGQVSDRVMRRVCLAVSLALDC